MTINLSAIRRLRVRQADDLGKEDGERTLVLRRYILGLSLVAALAKSEDRYTLREGCQLRLKPGHAVTWREVRFEGDDVERAGLTEEVAAVFAAQAAAVFGVAAPCEVEFDGKTAEKWLTLDKKKQDKLRREKPMTQQFTDSTDVVKETMEPKKGKRTDREAK